MKISNKYKWGFFLIYTLVIFILGWLSSNAYKDQTKSISYTDGPLIADSIIIDSTNLVEEKKSKEIPIEYITKIEYKDKEIYKYLEVDTAKIIADYLVKRSYEIDLFDDSKLGKLTLYPEIEFNKLNKIRYSFIPKITTVTYDNKNSYLFMVDSYINTNSYVGIGGTLIKSNLGIGYSYHKNFNSSLNYHQLKFSYVFR